MDMGSPPFSMEFERRTYELGPPTRITPSIKTQIFAPSADHGADGDEDDAKMAWLRSQIIGADVEFDSPFGKRALTYADHTASGRSLHCIESYVIQEVLPYYGNTHTDDSYVGHAMSKMVRNASDYIKKRLGGGAGDVLLFCGSGTTAAIKRLQEVMGLAVPSIMRERFVRALRAEERWVVFIGPYEHHSNVLSWRQSLAEVVEIGMDEEGMIDIEALAREIGSPKFEHRPKLGSFSACSNVTGIQTDTRALARLLHRHGAFACFDFAANGPYEEINMRSGELDGYDAVFLSPHKFLGGPGTPGVLLMNEALYRLKASPPSMCGGGTVRYVNGYSEDHTLYFDGVEEREDAGTPQITQKIRAALAFWVKDYIGRNLHERLYVDVALKRLLANPNVQVLGNTSVRRLPIVSFLVLTPDDKKDGKKKPVLHGRFVARLLNDLFGVQARGGCSCASLYGHHLLGIDEKLSLELRSVIQKGYEGLKPGWTRVSFSYYMSKEEFAFVLAAVEFIAEYGHRFLSLYHFDWKTGNWTFRKRSLKYQQMREELAGALSELSLSDGVMSPRVGVKGGRGVWDKFTARTRDTITNKYASYMNAAKGIVEMLPELPTPRRVPEDVDIGLVLFRF